MSTATPNTPSTLLDSAIALDSLAQRIEACADARETVAGIMRSPLAAERSCARAVQLRDIASDHRADATALLTAAGA